MEEVKLKVGDMVNVVQNGNITTRTATILSVEEDIGWTRCKHGDTEFNWPLADLVLSKPAPKADIIHQGPVPE